MPFPNLFNFLAESNIHHASESQQALLASFRTLPRNQTFANGPPPSSGGGGGAPQSGGGILSTNPPLPPPHHSGTLPLKSSLKKTLNLHQSHQHVWCYGSQCRLSEMERRWRPWWRKCIVEWRK